jgi:hypothetical protein
MKVSINGGKKKKLTTPWPMPVQAGAERYLNGIWFSGKRAPARFVPIINVIENEEDIRPTIKMKLVTGAPLK